MEVAVDNFDSALQAEEGGAIRIELCCALSEGGLTPSVGFLKMCKAHLNIPVFPMIRCRGGDFVYSTEEIQIMINDLKILKDNGADGFVFGVLKKDNTLDDEKCKELLTIAQPKPCTLHRAFDETKDCENALETAIKLGFTRILTSGQRKTAIEGINTITNLINQAKSRIIIMPGAGVNIDNIEEILLTSKAKEFHGSAKEKLIVNGHYRYVTDKANVSKMVSIFQNFCN